MLSGLSGLSGLSAVCGSAAFSPTQLSGYVNSPYNIALLRSQGKLWQNTAMTVAAVADGDPVRRIDCNGTYYDAPSDAARPLLWDEGGGKWSLSFDGVDDGLSLSTRGIPQPSTVGVSVIVTGNAAGNNVFVSGTNNLDFRRSSGVCQMAVNYAVSSAAMSMDAWHRVVGCAAVGGQTSTLRFDGAETTGDLGAFGSAAQTWIGRDFSSLRLGGRIAGVTICTGLLSAGDRAALDTYLTALAP